MHLHKHHYDIAGEGRDCPRFASGPVVFAEFTQVCELQREANAVGDAAFDLINAALMLLARNTRSPSPKAPPAHRREMSKGLFIRSCNR
jgi:hypothetical protein